jgi:hypothetical protein
MGSCSGAHGTRRDRLGSNSGVALTLQATAWFSCLIASQKTSAGAPFGA